LLLSKKGRPIANVKASHTISKEMYDVWRLDKDTFVQSWEDRFIIERGYIENMSKAITG
jgi:3-hydroxy-3-methylglutaryl CoA synthase